MIGALASDQGDLVAALFEIGRRRRHPSGSVLCFEGDPSPDVLLISAGDVKLECAVGTRPQMVELLGPGEWLGEMGVLGCGRRSATAVALTVTDVHVVDARDFEALVHTRPHLMNEVLTTSTRRLARTSRRQAELGSTDALGRVCGRLLELADRFGEVSSDGIHIRSPLTQADLASWTGVSRETVVKALATLRGLEWIRARGRRMTLLDPDALRCRGSFDVPNS